MEEITTLLQSLPWTTIGGVLIAINAVLLLLKITKKLLLLAVGAVLIVIGLYTGVLHTPLCILPLMGG